MNPSAILRVCAPIFISTLPWSATSTESYSPWFTSIASQSNLNLSDPIPAVRHLLLQLITSCIRSLRRLLPITRICQFPVPSNDSRMNDLDAVDCMIISWCQAFRVEFNENMSSSLGLAYISLIQSAVDHLSADGRVIAFTTRFTIKCSSLL